MTSLREVLETGWDDIIARDAAPYDGVLGALPEWVPERIRNEFKIIRNRALDLGYGAEEVRTYIEWVAPHNPADWTAVPPPDIRDDCIQLCDLKAVLQLPKPEALEQLGGRELVSGFRLHERQRKRRELRTKQVKQQRIIEQEMANDLWRKNARLSKRTVAARIEKALRKKGDRTRSAEAIRKDLQPPEA